MATAATVAITDPALAPWKSLFQSHVSRTQEPTYFTLSTVARNSNGVPVPRGRLCNFRGFFGELKLHPSAEMDLQELDELNPPLYESDMLTFTTDTRMAKIEELAQSEGAVEAVFWIEDAATQWRVHGKAFVIGGPAAVSEEQAAREEIRKGLRPRHEGSQKNERQGGWSWDHEVTAYFANHTPVLRGLSFSMSLRHFPHQFLFSHFLYERMRHECIRFPTLFTPWQ
jgi:pyridoxamine 5'-phosphate oxidase